MLNHRFPDAELNRDVRALEDLPNVDLLAAGFPCQDLSQAGRTEGVQGKRSSLVKHVFRLLDRCSTPPKWLLIENVPFMLSLDRGRAMHFLTGELARRGWRWAYRVVDTRAFGLPHRRLRVMLLASRSQDPRSVLFEEAVHPVEAALGTKTACGFYWTEGNRGLGWAVDAVPTLKSGSGIGIPSPPAIWLRSEPSQPIVVPDIKDGERLQGFPHDWTVAALGSPRAVGARWRLVGNAVSVPVAQWIAERVTTTEQGHRRWAEASWPSTGSWPAAAWAKEIDAFEWRCRRGHDSCRRSHCTSSSSSAGSHYP